MILLEPGACEELLLTLVLLAPLLMLLQHHFTGSRQLLNILFAVDGSPLGFMSGILSHLSGQVSVQLVSLQLLLLLCEISSEVVFLRAEVCPCELFHLLDLLLLAGLALLDL